MRVPSTHHALSHDALRRRLALTAKQSYLDVEPSEQRTWDPLTHTHTALVDLGRGLLDSYALALHVLWTYQQAWAEEGFLATARLDSSVAKLLAEIGYQPRPGVAATGLQHFKCKTGTSARLPAGVTVISPAADEGEQQVVYETLAAAHITPELNEIQPFLPARRKRRKLTGRQKGFPSDHAGEPQAPPRRGGLFGDDSVLDALRERIEAARHGPLEDRRVARARADARRLAALVKDLDLDGNDACKKSLDSLCKKLCDAQKIVSQAKPPQGQVGSLSESQELLARLLRILEKRYKDAVDALEEALAPCAGESRKDYARRLDRMVTFLDTLIGILLQDARDQLVLLHGSGALDRLDRAFGPSRTPVCGWAAAGTDALYLMPVAGKNGGKVSPSVRAGDWLIIAEDVATVGSDGKQSEQRVYREAVRVTRLRHQVPKGERTELLRVTFRPPLARSYRLDDTVVLGNNVRISDGATVVEVGTPSSDQRTIPLSKGPLTWLRSSKRAGGRRPEVELHIGNRTWKQVDSLVGAGPDDAVFAVETVPGGGARIRLGDGENGASLPLAADIELTYRVGLGSGGNRDALRVTKLSAVNPAVETTFNPLAITGGSDAEPAGRARMQGPATVGAGDRAVSVHDVRALASVYDGVSRARVFHDPVRRRKLVVVVAGPNASALAQAELTSLRAYLLGRVPPGIDVQVENRRQVEVHMNLLLRVVAGADPIDVVRDARLRLGLDRESGVPRGLLDPEHMDLGDDLQLSQVYDALRGVPGLVASVVRSLHRGPERVHPKRRVLPRPNDRVVAHPRELLIWAPSRNGVDGVEIHYERARDL